MRSTSAFTSESTLDLESTSSLSAVLPPLGEGNLWSLSSQPATLLQRSSLIDTTNSSIAFIDSAVPDYQTLLTQINPGTEIYLLNPLADAVTQITQVLAGRSQIASLYLVSHGQAGQLQLGTTLLNRDHLTHYTSQLQAWAQAFTTDADILLYGCYVAEGEAGNLFVEQLSQLTGADIAASDDRTGHTALNGDWVLEFTTGAIEAQPLFQPAIDQTYQAVLDGTYFNLAAGNFSQNWTATGLIVSDDDWSGVPSVIGYRGDGLTGVVGANPQTIVADGSATPIDVMANQTNPNTLTTGGIAEFNLANPTVALQASGTADAPQLVLHLDATGRQNVRLSLNLRDIDNSADNAITPIAIQYRIGNTGNFVNLPDGYVSDATLGFTATNITAFTRETQLTILLPTAVNNQSQVQVRMLTTNATGNDEWVGIDDIQVTSSAIAANAIPVAVADTYTVAENGTLTTAPTVTSLLLDSDLGNYIGQSDYYRYTPYTGLFTATRNFDNGVSISYTEPGVGGHWWYLDFAAANDQLLTPGLYPGATRYPFQAATVPGVSVGGDGRGYNMLTGEFTVNQVIYGTGNQIISFDATFQEYGDGDPATESFRGRIQYRATTGLLPGVLANDTDVEGTHLTAALVAAPANGSLIFNPDGSFTYTPNTNFSGIDTFTYVANDTIANSVPTTVTINVTGANDPPIHTLPASITTDEDTPLAFTGTNTISVTDADAGTNPIRTSLTLPTGQGTLNLTAQAGLTIAGNGTNSLQLEGTIAAINSGLSTLIYTPPTNANSTTLGGTVTLTIVSDDQGNTGTGGALTDTDTILITINPVNDAPVANNNGFSTAEDTGLTVPGAGVLGNDSDIDSAGLNAILVTGPVQGNLTLNVNGSFTYTPNANFNGSDSFTYQANDGTLTSNIATVTITVTPVNDAPIANPNSFTAVAGTPLTIAAPGVLNNDTDLENDLLQVLLVTAPTQGTLSLNPDGSFTYTAGISFSGTDSFTYRVNDGTADSNIATVGLTVTHTPPIVTAPEPVLEPIPQSVIVSTPLVNLPPELIVPKHQSMEPNQRRTLAGIQVYDLDAGDRPIRLNLTVSQGTLSLIDLTGITIVGGKNNSRNMTIVGSQAQINQVLERLVYRSAKKFRGTDAIILTVNDLHASQALTTQKSIAIDVGRKFRKAKVKGKQGIKQTPKPRR